jgi:hypothetical protein
MRITGWEVLSRCLLRIPVERVDGGCEKDVSGWGVANPFKPNDLARLASGLVVFFSFRASIAWFWMRSARFRRPGERF